MSQATENSTGPQMTGKQAGQIFTIIADAKLVALADRAEANEFDQLSADLVRAEQRRMNDPLADVATRSALRAEADAELAAARAAAGQALAAERESLHELLAKAAGTLRLIDHVLASIG